MQRGKYFLTFRIMYSDVAECLRVSYYSAIFLQLQSDLKKSYHHMDERSNQAHTLLYKHVYGSVIRNTKTLMAAVGLK